MNIGVVQLIGCSQAYISSNHIFITCWKTLAARSGSFTTRLASETVRKSNASTSLSSVENVMSGCNGSIGSIF